MWGTPPSDTLDGVFDPAVLWAGAVATTLVAGLVSIVGVVATQALPDVELIAPASDGAYVATAAWRLTAAAVVGALAAALLMHLLLLLTPRPLLFFRCVAVLMTATLTLWPFTTGAAVASKVATALVHLAIGASVTSLTATVARHVQRH
jgi:hypothetical protein